MPQLAEIIPPSELDPRQYATLEAKIFESIRNITSVELASLLKKVKASRHQALVRLLVNCLKQRRVGSRNFRTLVKIFVCEYQVGTGGDGIFVAQPDL